MAKMTNTYTTADGQEVKLKAISMMEFQEIRLAIIKQAKDSGKQIEPPTYTVTVGDSEQTFTHDEKSIVEDVTSQSDKDAWQEYIKTQSEIESELNTKISTLVYSDGVVVDVIPTEWEERRKWKGLDIPENYYDKKVKYVTTEVLKTIEDLQQAVLIVMQLSTQGVNQEEIEAAEATFLSAKENVKQRNPVSRVKG